MTDFSKYDVVVVKFPFASSLKYKAREKDVILTRLGTLSKKDAEQLEIMIDGMC